MYLLFVYARFMTYSYSKEVALSYTGTCSLVPSPHQREPNINISTIHVALSYTGTCSLVLSPHQWEPNINISTIHVTIYVIDMHSDVTFKEHEVALYLGTSRII